MGSISKKYRTSEYFRYCVVFVLLILAFLLAVVVNINSGSVDISVVELFNIIFGSSMAGTTDYNIVWKIRLPRLLTAAVLGGALSISGFLLQTFFRNPIAGPFVLGISSGAKMMVAFMMIVALKYVGTVSNTMLVAAAFLGSLVALGFVLFMSRRIKSMSMLLVAGIMIGYICSAVTNFFVTFASENEISNLYAWSLGSFSGASWDNLKFATVIVAIIVGIVFLLAKPIGAYQLGESYAQSMGVNVKVFRVVLILLSSILSACVTAFAGPISFVGIAVPHLVKLFLNTAKPIIVIPAVFISGAIFCMMCDLIARTVFSPTELTLSTVTAIFGVPVVLSLMLKRQSAIK